VEVLQGLVERGVPVGGTDPRATVRAALNNAQDLFEKVGPGVWAWIDKPHDIRVGITGKRLADVAVVFATVMAPDGRSVKYGEVSEGLAAWGVVIRGGDKGMTVRQALRRDARFESLGKGHYMLKRSNPG
jgi:hypothetical protein